MLDYVCTLTSLVQEGEVDDPDRPEVQQWDKFPVNADAMVAMSTPITMNGTVFFGEKHTEYYQIDSHTGFQIAEGAIKWDVGTIITSTQIHAMEMIPPDMKAPCIAAIM
eukprot:gene18351-828_t